MSALSFLSLFVFMFIFTCNIANASKYDSLFKYNKLKNNLKISYKHDPFSKYQELCNQFTTFVQRVDHLNFGNDDLYMQRYILSDNYWQPGGPIFFYTGNEGDIQLFCENTGFMWEIAPKFNAMIIFAEHRYYGESLPYGNKSFEKPYINYLTSEQALADYAYLITSIKTNRHGASNSPVIVFGGSYGGMLSAWFRMKYPNMAIGAIAASAPIWQFISDCDIFAKVTSDSFRKSNENCPAYIRSSWSAINQLGATADGLKQLTSIFRLCKPLGSNDVVTLKAWLADIYGNLAMTNYPYETNFLNPVPANPVSVVCSNITNIKNPSDPVELLTGIYSGINVYLNYTGSAQCFDISSDTPSSLGDFSWEYQTCTEFVFPTCSNGVDDMFEYSKWDFNQYVDACNTQFGVIPRYEWPIIYYGGKSIDSYTNIVFTNGDLDPWLVSFKTELYDLCFNFLTKLCYLRSGGGVLKNITDELPAYIVHGGAHHLDLRSSNPNDPLSVIQTRNTEMLLIQEWIAEYAKKH